MRRVSAASGLGLLLGLAWWAPGVSLAAIPVALGLADPRDPDAPAVWIGAALVAVAVALAAAPWLAIPRPHEERVFLSVCFGLFLAGSPRVWAAGRVAIAGAVASAALGFAVHARWVPGGWIASDLATAVGIAIPGLPWRSTGLGVGLGLVGWLAWWRFGRRAGPLWLGLSVGAAVSAWPFQVASPPRIDGWYLGRPTVADEIVSADPRRFPRELQRPTLASGVAALAGIALGAALARPAAADRRREPGFAAEAGSVAEQQPPAGEDQHATERAL